MKIIVMGCGRVGLQVSQMLADQGHEVTVIDHDANAIARLSPDFKGKVVRGIGFDRSVLIEANVETAEAFVAASSSDNANIIAARIARNIFHVPRVVARLYDPLRAEIYQRLGLTTISTTTWGAERICEVVTHTDLDVAYTFQKTRSEHDVQRHAGGPGCDYRPLRIRRPRRCKHHRSRLWHSRG